MWIVILIVIIVLILLKDSKNSSNNHYGSSYSPKRSYRTFKPKQSYQPKKSAEVKGIEGEKNVRKITGNTVIGQKYVFNDYVILDNGKTTQIDHIVVTVCGVFVIETKNYMNLLFKNNKHRF